MKGEGDAPKAGAAAPKPVAAALLAAPNSEGVDAAPNAGVLAPPTGACMYVEQQTRGCWSLGCRAAGHGTRQEAVLRTAHRAKAEHVSCVGSEMRTPVQSQAVLLGLQQVDEGCAADASAKPTDKKWGRQQHHCLARTSWFPQCQQPWASRAM